MCATAAQKPVQFSPLVLADSLIMLAERADRAGYREIACSLVTLADRALDYPPVPLPLRRPTAGFVDCLFGRV